MILLKDIINKNLISEISSSFRGRTMDLHYLLKNSKSWDKFYSDFQKKFKGFPKDKDFFDELKTLWDSYHTKESKENSLNTFEDLRKWFGKGKTGSTSGGGWDRYNTKGEKVGKCGDSEDGDAYAACLSKEKAAKLGPDGRASFVKRKRAAQSKAGDAKKGGEQSKGQKPTFVKTGA